MQKRTDKLTELVASVVEPMGYELVGVEYLTNQSGGNVLRTYIDAEGGIGVEDCARVSHQLSGVLDVENPIRGQYNLEVSSPGLDRPLFYPEHFQKVTGKTVSIKLDSSIVGRRKYKGVLHGLENDSILVEVDGEVYSLLLDQISSARLVPQF